jgi:hypothetical protein
MTANSVEAYIDTISTAAFATSKFTLTLDTYGELWRANQKIAQSVARVTDMQWEYNKSLEAGGDKIKKLSDSLFVEFKRQSSWANESYGFAKENLSTVYAQGKVNYKVDMTDAVSLGAGGINVDKTKIQDWIEAGQITQEQADDWIESLQKEYENMTEATEGLRAAADSIKERYQQGKDSYYELREMVQETIVGLIEKQIELEQTLVDSTQEANEKLLSKM